MMFQTDLLPNAAARAFEPPPPEPIWLWAEDHVWLDGKEAAEPGPYRSAKTPWTRRLQEVARDPRMLVPEFDAEGRFARWVVVDVSEFNVKKSSQSGFSEACLNVVRWRARYRPCNIIYAIDTQEEAENISNRLKPHLAKLDPDFFMGDDKDLGTLVMRLAAMDIWLYGSFSSGKFANKQAPLLISDELEEHKKPLKDTSTDRSLASRKKTADDGLQFNLSKPKRGGGPICRLFDRGNREEYHIQCPTCGEWQWFTFFPEKKRKSPFSNVLREVEVDGLKMTLPDPLPLGQTREIKTGRIVFEHCLNSIGEWDELKVLREAYHECGYCKQPISEADKPGLVQRGMWLPTGIGTPGVISQHMSDLCSSDKNSSTGRIALEFLAANKEGRQQKQGVMNHRFGDELKEEANKTDDDDIKDNIAGAEGDPFPAYRRGTCPFVPNHLILGSDIGLTYAKWVVIAVYENAQDCAVIDWGTELAPEDIAEIMRSHSWPCSVDDHKYQPSYGFMDIKYRRRDSYKACLGVRNKGKFPLYPTAGLGGGATRNIRLWALNSIPNYPEDFKLLVYNDREAKSEFYIDCLKKKERRIWFPEDVLKDAEFVAELTAEEMVLNDDNIYEWEEETSANHYGDCLKDAITGLSFLTRKNVRTAERVDSVPST